jgi:hypothetical protein
MLTKEFQMSSVVDQDPEQYVYGPPGSGSGPAIILYGSGSGSFHQQAKKVSEALIPLFCYFFLTFSLWVPVPPKVKSKKTLKKKLLIFCWHLVSH